MNPPAHLRPSRVGGQGADPTVVLLRDGIEVVTWPLAGDGSPDLVMVDELARIVLAAHRAGCSLRLRDPGGRLSELLEVSGLSGVVAGCALQAVGEPEGPEEVGVEEVVVPDDPVT